MPSWPRPARGRSIAELCTSRSHRILTCSGLRGLTTSSVPMNAEPVSRRLVVHCKREPYDVYIGRPRPWEGLVGEWGNPFSHHPQTTARFRTATVEEAIACYEEWLKLQPELLSRIREELRGKVLGCWCHPKPCHGDVLARIANG